MEQISQLAQKMLDVIAGNTYIAGWNICVALGIERDSLDCSIPGTKYDEALQELINAELVVELPNLGCRYRVTEKYKNLQSPLQGGDGESLEFQIATMQECCVAMASNIVDQGKRVADQAELLKEWKKYGQSPFASKSADELIHLTEQLLGEERSNEP